MTSIFLTGASGYIGGQVLKELSHTHPEYEISALVRSSDTGKQITDVYPEVRVVNGDLDDVDLVEKEASQASIVLHIAANRHLPSVQAIHRGLSKKQPSEPAYWIQVSGASLLASDEFTSDSFKPGEASSAVFDDVADVDKLQSLIRKHSFRDVDNYLLDVAAETSSIKIALVLPPIIYGLGQGPVNTRSVQIPSLAKTALEKGHAVRVGKGLSRWGSVHVEDVARIFASLTEAGAKGNQDDKIWGGKGIYLTGVEEINFAEISDKIASAAVEQGLIKTIEVEALQKPEADTVLPHGSVLFGTNARSRARRAAELLGWRPQGESLEAEIPRAVAEEAKRLATSA
ncbi:Fc.00g058300.m01.CDS01 [Cosmosporella sp. VM-42]